MARDAHYLVLAGYGAGSGALAGLAVGGRRAALPGMTAGFLTPLPYLPLWFAFDLPPEIVIDL